MRKLITYCIITFGLSSFMIGQDFSEFNCPTSIDGKMLQNPYTGGFHAPQLSQGDFNRDGLKDLFVFDRAGSVPMIFLKNAGSEMDDFSFTRSFRYNLPDSLISWAYVRDYDRDGIDDLMVAPTTSNTSGVQIYKGKFENDEWTFGYKRIGKTATSDPIIWYFTGSVWSNLYVSFVDQPEIIDVDSDGDLDILSFEPSGAYVNYYRNLQEDRGLPKDTMTFELADFCFGKFKEAGSNATIFLSDDPNACAIGLQEDEDLNKGGGLHQGSTIVAIDPDLDNDYELVLGDVDGVSLAYLENIGDKENNFMGYVSYEFPENNISFSMASFPAGFSIDLNNDGLNEFIGAPNATTKAQNVDNIWLYENTGNIDNPYNLTQRDFLSSQTIDLGSFSVPAFIDEDGDGLTDILVGSGGYYNNLEEDIMFLALFRNIGTKDNPAFDLIDDDYLGFSEYQTTSTRPAPAFGDLDNDGDQDLLIAGHEGTLYYYENSGSFGGKLQFNNPIVEYKNIRTGTRGRPAIADINGDGLMDIIIGETRPNINNQDTEDIFFGTVAYYENIGSSGAPDFNGDLSVAPNNPALGRMHTKTVVGNAESNSTAPHFIKIEDETHILLGSESGKIKRYLLNPDDLSAQFEILDSIVDRIDEGSHTTLTTNDIDNDGFLEMLIGNYRGGLSFYNTPYPSAKMDPTDETFTKSMHIYPNPVTDEITIEYATPLNSNDIQLYSTDGKEIRVQIKLGNKIDLSSLGAGIYFLRLHASENHTLQKIIKI